ncbi:MAG: hypothetical protein U0271_44435, partial [Polyangiaceae bacterium]
YQESVLPPRVPRVSIELGITTPWHSIIGRRGLAIGHDTFGASAPAKVLAKQFGFTPDAVAAKVRAWYESGKFEQG